MGERAWVDAYPVGLLPPTQPNIRLGVLPPRRAFWRRTIAAPVRTYLCDESNAIPADKVQKDNIEALFPGHAELFDPVVAQVLGAAASGFMNDWEALPQEQVKALRLLMQSTPAQCSWAADAVEFLISAGCYADDSLTLPCVVEVLKNTECDKALVQKLLTRTNVDKVLSKHGIPRAPSRTTIREHLHRIAPSDLKYMYGLGAPAEAGPSSRTRGRKRTADDDGSGTDDEADKQVDLYEQEEYDLFHDGGKAPVGQGKLMM